MTQSSSIFIGLLVEIASGEKLNGSEKRFNRIPIESNRIQAFFRGLGVHVIDKRQVPISTHLSLLVHVDLNFSQSTLKISTNSFKLFDQSDKLGLKDK